MQYIPTLEEKKQRKKNGLFCAKVEGKKKRGRKGGEGEEAVITMKVRI